MRRLAELIPLRSLAFVLASDKSSKLTRLSARRKLIDAAWDGSASGGDVLGNTGSGDYTTVAWVDGVGMGATFTPANGDTGKTLFLPNAGERNADGTYNHGSECRIWPSNNASNGWHLRFIGGYPSGIINADLILDAYPLRCVRS